MEHEGELWSESYTDAKNGKANSTVLKLLPKDKDYLVWSLIIPHAVRR
ncbi:hypothetical protein [Pontibacter korlensis]